MNDLVPTTQQPPVALATVLGVEPEALMAYAIKVANTLAKVLREQNMTQKFGQGEHVKTEGWQLAGSLMGFITDEGDITELADGSYEAQAILKSVSTGRAIASGSALCGVDEPIWKSKAKFNRRSMAVTRAIGRVYAQNFRWLIKLAGFEGTPAEEMPEQKVAPKRVYPTYTGTTAQQQTLKAMLVQAQVPEQFWEEIGERMRGRLCTDADVNTVIAAVRAGEPEDILTGTFE